MQECDRRRTKLLVVGAFPPAGTKVFGGIVTSCRELLRSSFVVRHDVRVVDSTQRSNPPPTFLVRAWLATLRLFKYTAVLQRERPEVVLLFCSSGASFVEKGVMAWIARFRGVPAIIFPRGGRLLLRGSSRLGQVALRVTAGGVKMILCQGSAWQRFALEVLRLPVESCPIVQNWTATPELLQVGKARRERTGGTFTLLFVGWVEKEKGVFELLEALRLLSRDRVVLRIVGDGNAMPAVREFIAQNELSGRVIISGWLGVDALIASYRDADVFVLPSWVEGLPNAMIEAMAAGLPVVVTRVGNIPDVVTNRKQALLIPPRDSGALRLSIEELLESLELRTALSAEAHDLALREFAVETAANRISDAVEYALQKTKASSNA